MKQSLSDVRPSHHPSLHCPHCEDDFLPFTMSYFDLPGPRYAVSTAQNGNFGDGSRTLWPAMWAKSVKRVPFPPWNCHLGGLVMAKNKITFCPLLPKLWGFKVKHIIKWSKSTKFWGRFGGRLMFWPATQAKKVEIQNYFFPQNFDFYGLMMGQQKFHFGHSSQSYTQLKFSQNCDFAGLMMCQQKLNSGHSSQSYMQLKFRQKVALCGGFWSSVHSLGIFLTF